MITLERDATRAIGIRPAVSAVIFDRRGRLLLQQRSDGGQWGLPGGSVEIGESVRDAVAREVREETGLIVAVRRLVGVYSVPSLQLVRYPDGNVWHYVSVSFECAVRGGSLATCDETLALEYFPLRRLPPTLLDHHRIRIRDASSGKVAPFIR
ncbi:MAG TPA: NUDIX domain-containing protein [Methylomirabilota bacterium]|nr:NUDIX domain-containing protein [Methylomirabilota bacterium]